jgi:transcription elongation factor Elf1
MMVLKMMRKIKRLIVNLPVPRLKPCPLCGSKVSKNITKNRQIHKVRIHCDKCGVTLEKIFPYKPFSNENNVYLYHIWNHRIEKEE